MDFIPPEAIAKQEYLLRTSTGHFEVAYLRARRKGIKNPVIFILDLRDDYAKDLISSALGGPQPVEESLQRADQGDAPIATSFLSLQQAIKFLGDRLNEFSQSLRDWPNSPHKDEVPVMVLANGLATLAFCSTPKV